MREDPTLSVGADFESAEHTDDVPVGAGRVRECQSVERERRRGVRNEHAVGDPLSEQFTGLVVAAWASGLAGHIDVRDVVLVFGVECVQLGVGQDVLRRCDEVVDVRIAIAESGKRGEAWHGHKDATVSGSRVPR